MDKTLKREPGITLIALVITIIVLIILAGLAIGVVGNNGLLGKANKAEREDKIAKMYEGLSLKIVEIQIEKNGKMKLEDLDSLDGGKIYDFDVTVTNTSIETPSREIKLKDSSNFEATFMVDANMNIGTDMVEDLATIATSSTMVQQNFTISNMTGGTFRINVNAVDANNTQILYYYVNGECVYTGTQNYYDVTSLSTGPIEDNTTYLVRVYATKYNTSVTTGEGDNVDAWLACIGNPNSEGYSLENLDAIFANRQLLIDLLASTEADTYLMKSTEKIYPKLKEKFSVICSDSDLFTRICNQEYLFTQLCNDPDWRLAMYDGYEVTESILANSTTAINVMKSNTSQYQVVKKGCGKNSSGMTTLYSSKAFIFGFSQNWVDKGYTMIYGNYISTSSPTESRASAGSKGTTGLKYITNKFGSSVGCRLSGSYNDGSYYFYAAIFKI